VESGMLPRGFAEFYRSLLGPEADRQIQSLLAGPAVKVARAIPSRFHVAGLRSLAHELQLSLPKAEGAAVEPKDFLDDAVLVSNALAGRLSQCTAFDEGKFYLQSVPSYLVIKFLPLDGVEYVLDMCASPGGKALHGYDRMDRRRPVIVNEPAGARRMRLASVLKLYGADELPVLGIDGGLLCHFVINTIPLIVLDAPCSGEAHVLSHPQRRKEWTPRQTKMLAQRQLSLAGAAVHALRPNGILLYSTCALSPYENELLIHELLSRFEDALEPVPWPVGDLGSQISMEANILPLTGIPGMKVDPRIPQLGWRFRPADFGEPFFAVLLKKTRPTEPRRPVEPYPVEYQRRGRGSSPTAIVKVGPGRREFMVPATWPELPPLPYLRIGR
jgi:16S rRNA C967 or C1407 C5-methylase (RsmB/RsmF family)